MEQIKRCKAPISIVNDSFERFSSMNAIFGKSINHQRGVGNMAKPVNFYCSAPTAKSVQLVGDFNGWNPLSIRCGGRSMVAGLSKRSLRTVITGIVFWWMANQSSTRAAPASLAMNKTREFLLLQ